jgi:uncharacterized protein YecE (DUF72 family)
MSSPALPFFIGCAVWAYKDWVGDLFPPASKQADFLRLYSRRLTTVEGNTTFYATPKPEVVQRWLADTPPEFRFCFKLPREVSHSGPLVPQVALAADFVARLAPLGERLGPFFLQLPPAYGPANRADLERFLAAWPAEYPLAVEVRHPAWYAPPDEPRLMELLDRQLVGRVVMDVRPIKLGAAAGEDMLLDRSRERKPDVPMRPLRSANLALVRYIGNPQPDLNDPLLDEWAARLAEWLREGTQVYCFMHCPDDALSPALCRALYHRLEKLVPLPPLPWDSLSKGSAEQTSMF